MKTINDVKADMSALYDELAAGTVEIKLAAELANITGKYLKAVQLDLAERIFEDNKSNRQKALTAAANRQEALTDAANRQEALTDAAD